MKKFIISGVVIIATVSLFLLTSASGNTELLSEYYPYLIALNGGGVVALGLMVGIQLYSLWRDYRVRKFGSLLKFRFLWMFSVVALVPGIILYLVSMQFLVKSIDSWFDVRVERALEGGVVLGQTAMDYLASQLETKARDAALDLDGGTILTSLSLNQLRERLTVDSATLMNSSGKPVVSVADSVMDSLLPPMASASKLRQARAGMVARSIDSNSRGGLTIRVIVMIPARSLINESYFLQLTQNVPESFARHVDAVQDTYQEYQQLVLGREGIKNIYSLTLTLTLLLALLAAVALAFVLARRLAAPLLILAEGTQAVAMGDYRPRQALSVKDELAVLLKSFNRMTQQLEEAREQTLKSRAEMEAAHAYLSSVLANINTGVLAFGNDDCLRAVNKGAANILHNSLSCFESVPLAQWDSLIEFRDAVLEGFNTHDGDWNRQLELQVADAGQQTLLIHGARLPETGGGGKVVVFDDLTQLITAQRASTWAEVARRMAHEIKNPLTPIQLSAERLNYKLLEQLDEKGQDVLERSTRTIIKQVDIIKNLVNAFRDYARLPSPNLKPANLNELITDVLNMYESESAKVTFVAELADHLPEILADSRQVGQILHNVMQNAEDALEGRGDGIVTISTRQAEDLVVLAISDNGPGFPAELLARTFEPYFTTKTRGTGLGLAIIKKIIDEHGGSVVLTNSAEGGANVTINFRVASTAAIAESAADTGG